MPNTLFRRRVVGIAGLLAVLILILSAFVIWKGSLDLVTPVRRTLLPYHHDWLDNSAAHGISIQRWEAMKGLVPCLFVMPEAFNGLSPRGETIRKQLRDRGIELPEFGNTLATLVLLHGRNGRKEDLLPVAERFCAVGFRCILPDLPAHGESPITVASFGASDFDATLTAGVLDEAIGRFRLPHDPSGLWGMSMGGAYLARSAAVPSSPWKALVVVCSFDSLDEVVERKLAAFTGPAAPLYRRAIGAACVARGGVDPAAVQPARWAASVSTPLMIAHGTKDELIPPEFGRRLFGAYPSPDKQWILVEGGRHDNVLVTEMPLYATMAEWFLEHLQNARN